MKRRFFLLVLLILLAGCAPAATPQPTPPPDQAQISGRLPGAADIWPDEPVSAFLVRFFRSEGKEGAYLFTSNDPKVALDPAGSFTFTAAPGEYLLAFGPEVGRALFAGQDGELLILTVSAGQALDAGEISLLR